jgi:hypothetical protein
MNALRLGPSSARIDHDGELRVIKGTLIRTQVGHPPVDPDTRRLLSALGARR